MKTAISIPDSIFQSAESLAQRLGISRSELYAKAIAEYTHLHQNKNVTKVLNEIYSEQASSLDEGLNAMQMRSIPQAGW